MPLADIPTRAWRFAGEHFPAGVTAAGRIRVTLDAPVYDVDGQEIIGAGTTEVQLVDGLATGELPVTDAATGPSGWVYRIESRTTVLDVSRELAWPAGDGSTVDLAELLMAPLPDDGPQPVDWWATPAELAAETAARIAADAQLVAAVDTNHDAIPGKRALVVFDANGDVDDIILEDV